MTESPLSEKQNVSFLPSRNTAHCNPAHCINLKVKPLLQEGM